MAAVGTGSSQAVSPCRVLKKWSRFPDSGVSRSVIDWLVRSALRATPLSTFPSLSPFFDYNLLSKA